MNIQSVKQRYGIIGRSEKLDRAIDIALKVSSTDLSVLIQGESGVGKEAISKIIHDNSKRKHNKFIGINTGAIPAGTINSELFGHEKGAFTGATTERKGYFETANTGTIFLDEIGEMPLDTQAFLLRVLENNEIIKVGSSKVEKVDVRVVAATNVNLVEKINKGKFREDLYYRLNTVPIYLPALHERREDIDLLFRKFSIDFAEKYHSEPVRLLPDAKEAVLHYRWPGNIRELRNLVEQLSILKVDEYISSDQLMEIAPQIFKSNLPISINTNKQSGADSIEEREILYKFLFDMKSDLNDLKNLVFELINSNDLNVSNTKELRSLKNTNNYSPANFANSDPTADIIVPDHGDDHPIVIERTESFYDSSVEVEESLSLDDKTKELIIKALKKHNNKRKKAAQDLGISERTLYRKIKEYGIEE